MRRAVVLVVFLFLLTVIQPPAGAAEAPARRLMAVGDTTADPIAGDILALAIADGATGFLGLGDYHYSAPPENWTALFAPLTSQGEWLIAGNHDDFARMRPGVAELWSADVNGVRIVGVNSSRDMRKESPQHVFARDALCNTTATMRVLVTHHNWWLLPGAVHPWQEYRAGPDAMDQLIVDCGVDLVLAGHEHNYQRMLRNGTHYVIAGTGGRFLYDLKGIPPGTVATARQFGYLQLDLAPDRIGASFRALGGTTLDAFSIGGFAASFDRASGNAWWLQVYAAGDGLASVDASIDGGAWKPLVLKSWGAWAASYPAPEGSMVRFRATNAAGSTSESGCYRWTAAAPMQCSTTPPPPPPPPPPSGFEARFTRVLGNGWWVQSDVSANAPIAAVRAQVDGGEWRPLTLKSWGAWAASFRVPPGSVVRLEAEDPTGAKSQSETCYQWPAATPVACGATPPPPPPTGMQATFSKPVGNDWWLQVKVDADRPLRAVDASIDGGAWKPLVLKPWGEWAASHHAPAGSSVVFRATGTDGAEARSGAFAWPP